MKEGLSNFETGQFSEKIEKLCSIEIIKNILVPRIWNNIQQLRCKAKCPWCGINCCGDMDCNDKYVEFEPEDNKELGAGEHQHSCHFHR